MKTANPCILTINGGSSSIRFALYQTGDPLKRGFSGKVDRIGLPGTILTFHDPVQSLPESRSIEASDHRSGGLPNRLARREDRLRFGDGNWAPGGARHEPYRAPARHAGTDG